MGKKTKKTRWRTLILNGHQSDSEESNPKHPKSFQHKYSKYPYSSHSTPIRKFQNDSSISTRSNSTASETKKTFNEDEYTRITTPRQDVLFKKGYLNKPKNYQTQTSTGTSSTANSTATCTPDHQSADGTEGTDLEYESPYVFPNGFIDQNGIYYINSFEPFPFVVYNSPIYYSEYPAHSRNKRCSTDSMTESMSPNNEEENSESTERLNNTPIVNQTYMQTNGYYYNGINNETDAVEEPKRLKKKRRRRISKSASSADETTTESSDENDAQNVLLRSLTKDDSKDCNPNTNKYSLKPDAQEFIPRSFQPPPFDPNVQFVNVPPNFIFPVFPPPPACFIPAQDPKVMVPPPTTSEEKEDTKAIEEKPVEPTEPTIEPKKTQKDIDIEKIVSKLEEAAKQQRLNEITSSSPAIATKHEASPKLVKKPPRQRFQRNPYRNENNPTPKTVVNKLNDCSSTNIAKKTKSTELKPPTTTKNQWISVLNRKKRKNKMTDEEEQNIEEIELTNQDDDQFESFDIHALVDVVPPSKVEEVSLSKLEEPSPPKLEEPQVLKSTETTLTSENIVVEEVKIEAPVENQPQAITEEIVLKSKKKKQEKNIKQTVIKKVMVTDNFVPEIPQETKNPKVQSPIVEEIIEKPSVTPEKKSKKKKKKTVKPVLNKIQSVSSSNTTLSNFDDSYDFLLDSSLILDTEQKTNVEISQELDRMIQKGMYTNLEEKLKALNINQDDGFFKTVTYTSEKPNSLQNFEEVLKRAKPVEEKNVIDIDFSKIKLPDLDVPSTSCSGVFVDEEQSKLKDDGRLRSTNVGQTDLKGEHLNASIEPKTINDSQNFSSHDDDPGRVLLRETTPKQDTLYPITQAVKDWMNKTRETTPDIEILKSPNTIYKEFCDNDAEVTLWSVSSENILEEDLLTCWENDLHNGSVILHNNDVKEIKGSSSQSNVKCLNGGHVEEGEEAMEVYESKYGQNEDYLNLKAEIEQQSRNFPRHGNLPYRAICCSIM